MYRQKEHLLNDWLSSNYTNEPVSSRMPDVLSARKFFQREKKAKQPNKTMENNYVDASLFSDFNLTLMLIKFAWCPLAASALRQWQFALHFPNYVHFTFCIRFVTALAERRHKWHRVKWLSFGVCNLQLDALKIQFATAKWMTRQNNLTFRSWHVANNDKNTPQNMQYLQWPHL